MEEILASIRRIISDDEAKPAEGASWLWPLPRLAGEHPRIIVHANDDRLGVDIGYEHLAFTELFVPVFAVPVDGLAGQPATARSRATPATRAGPGV